MKFVQYKPIMNNVKSAASQAIKLLTDNDCIFYPKTQWAHVTVWIVEMTGGWCSWMKAIEAEYYYIKN